MRPLLGVVRALAFATLLLCALAQAATAKLAPVPSLPQAHGRPGHAELLRDPTGRALTAWSKALDRARAGKGQARAAFWGASHTAADLWTGHLRRLWQAEYGDAGHGFVFPVRWNVGYRSQDLNVDSSHGWQVLRHRQASAEPQIDGGYIGLAAASSDSADFASLATTQEGEVGKTASELEIWLKVEANAGELLVDIDGVRQPVLAPQSRLDVSQAPMIAAYSLPDSAHTIRMQPKGGATLTLYGAVLERSTPGIILDQLGIPGMTAAIHLRWLESTWRVLVEHRHLDLIVLAYGTNEVGNEQEPIELYVDQWRKVLTRVRRALPEVSCILVGPTDRLGKDELGKKRSMPRTSAVIAAQRQVAAELSCAHWDAQAAMGGANAMKLWQKARLAQPDGVHLNREGYMWLGDLFDYAVVRGVREAKLHAPRPATVRPKPRKPKQKS